MSVVVYNSRKGYLTNHSDLTGDMFRLTVSCGGGMGGSKWSVLTKDNVSEDLINGGFVTVTKLNGESYMVNTNFVVDFYKISVSYDAQWIYNAVSSDYVTLFKEE